MSSSWEGSLSSCPVPFTLSFFEHLERLERQKDVRSFKKRLHWIMFLHLLYFPGRKVGAERMENSFQDAGVWRDSLGQVWPQGFLRSYHGPDVRGMRVSPPSLLVLQITPKSVLSLKFQSHWWLKSTKPLTTKCDLVIYLLPVTLREEPETLRYLLQQVCHWHMWNL